MCVCVRGGGCFNLRTEEEREVLFVFCRWQSDGTVSWCQHQPEQGAGEGGWRGGTPKGLAALKYVLSKVKEKWKEGWGERRQGNE